MKPTLIDTDILSLFFRNHPVVVNRFAEYAREHRVLNLSIITCYEVLSGLLHVMPAANWNRSAPLSKSIGCCRYRNRRPVLQRKCTLKPAKPVSRLMILTS